MIRINIAFRLPKDVETKAINIAVNLAKNKENYFFLDGITALSHVKIYAPVVEENKVPEILNTLEREVAKIEEVYLTVAKVSQNQGFVSIEFGLTPDIKKIQTEILTLIKDFRAENLSEGFLNGADYNMNHSEGSVQSLEKYGSVGIVNYHPHLTLFRLKNEIDAELAKRKVEWDIPRFKISKIGVFVMGQHGVCNELIEEFELKKL